MQTEHPSFENIYTQFKSRVFNTAYSYLKHAEEAEEITQDVFLEVYHALPGFRGDASLGTWIYRITIHKSLDHLRYRQRKKRFARFTALFHPQSGEDLQHAQDETHPGILLENKERSVVLWKALDTLPEKQRTAFILSKMEQLGNKEIAGVMQMSVGAIESLLSRAKDNLRKQIGLYYQDRAKE